jgi:hypothetical protein
MTTLKDYDNNLNHACDLLAMDSNQTIHLVRLLHARRNNIGTQIARGLDTKKMPSKVLKSLRKEFKALDSLIDIYIKG